MPSLWQAGHLTNFGSRTATHKRPHSQRILYRRCTVTLHNLSSWTSIPLSVAVSGCETCRPARRLSDALPGLVMCSLTTNPLFVVFTRYYTNPRLANMSNFSRQSVPDPSPSASRFARTGELLLSCPGSFGLGELPAGRDVELRRRYRARCDRGGLDGDLRGLHHAGRQCVCGRVGRRGGRWSVLFLLLKQSADQLAAEGAGSRAEHRAAGVVAGGVGRGIARRGSRGTRCGGGRGIAGGLPGAGDHVVAARTLGLR